MAWKDKISTEINYTLDEATEIVENLHILNNLHDNNIIKSLIENAANLQKVIGWLHKNSE